MAKEKLSQLLLSLALLCLGAPSSQVPWSARYMSGLMECCGESKRPQSLENEKSCFVVLANAILSAEG